MRVAFDEKTYSNKMSNIWYPNMQHSTVHLYKPTSLWALSQTHVFSVAKMDVKACESNIL